MQSERELLFRQCNIHDASCGTSTVELHNLRTVSGALKTTLTPKEAVVCAAEANTHKPSGLIPHSIFQASFVIIKAFLCNIHITQDLISTALIANWF